MQLEDFKKMFSNSKKGTLMLLDAPTGNGKSRGVTEFLCWQAMKDPNFRAFFISDQKKNIPIDDFLKFWNDAEHKQYADYERIAVVRSLLENVGYLVDDYTDGQVPKCLLGDAQAAESVDQALRKLAIRYQQYESMCQIGGDVDYWKLLAPEELSVRRALAKQLAKLCGLRVEVPLDKESQQVLLKKLSNSEFVEVRRWLFKRYPTINLEQFQIIIMTTDKFIRSFTPFFEEKGKSLLTTSLLNDALVVLDEFDRSKKKQLRKQIDQTLKIDTDLFSLFNTIKHGLDQININLPITVKNPAVEEGYYDDLQSIAKELQESYHLELLYKVTEAQYKANFLIHSLVENLSSDNVPWRSHLNKERNGVDVNHQQPDELEFRRMLYRVAGFIRRFTRYLATCARKYQRAKNSDTVGINERIEFEDAFRTVGSAMGLSYDQMTILLDIQAEPPYKSGSTKHKKLLSLHRPQPLQERGLDLYYFQDANDHSEQTIFNAAFYTLTPERYLLMLLKHCRIWGLSATANFETILDNYDLPFLKDQLGANFKQARQYLTAKTQREFDLKTRYRERGIQVQARMVGLKASVVKTLKASQFKQRVTNWDAIINLDGNLTQLIHTIESAEGKKAQYFLERYLALFESFIELLARPTYTSFLGLQAKLPDHSAEMNAGFINQVFETLKQQLVPNKVPVELRIISGRHNEIEAQLTEVRRLLAGGTRVYMLSAYQTLGVGQNLQHPISAFEKEHSLSIGGKSNEADKRFNAKDIDGMYLGDVTHLLTSPGRSGMNAETLAMVIELQYLRENNEINTEQLRSCFNKALNGQFFSLKDAPSLAMSYTYTIVQALGRMNRAFNKHPNPLVLTHRNVVSQIRTIGVEADQLSPEVQALLDCQEQKNTTQTEQSRLDQYRRQNYTKYCANDINRLVYRLQSDRQVAEYYQALRECMLKYPTISRAQLITVQNEFDENQQMGLQYLSNTVAPIVKYQAGVQHLDYGDFCFEDCPDEPQVEVSAEQAGLPAVLKYPGMRDYFERHEYATEWQPDEFILNPVQFINLYTGILGEAAGKFIFQRVLGYHLRDFLDIRHNELFDFKIGNQVAVDFKNWQLTHTEPAESARQAVLKKLETLTTDTGDEWRVIVINLFGKDPVNVIQTANQRIMEVPGLIDQQGQLILTQAAILKIGAFVDGKDD
ncbi:hypothetical protein [Lactiplantibacillus modestisalitolerans]|uniref:Helicase ATP-binding domain-containing protein n=1 Tax=Lactiplantibacillus modestisalitolerans TaxID=1457219 RepID=A0ABV5WUI6_9LACO|nr:hypothetical protein [Lactiplantibacillus modestisalitolerans]